MSEMHERYEEEERYRAERRWREAEHERICLKIGLDLCQNAALVNASIQTILHGVTTEAALVGLIQAQAKLNKQFMDVAAKAQKISDALGAVEDITRACDVCGPAAKAIRMGVDRS